MGPSLNGRQGRVNGVETKEDYITNCKGHRKNGGQCCEDDEKCDACYRDYVRFPGVPPRRKATKQEKINLNITTLQNGDDVSTNLVCPHCLKVVEISIEISEDCDGNKKTG